MICPVPEVHELLQEACPGITYSGNPCTHNMGTLTLIRALAAIGAKLDTLMHMQAVSATQTFHIFPNPVESS